jgi:nucleoside-diphosphate-sugar epimerase
MTTSPTHIVLGGNGVVGRETIRALRDRGLNAASVGRRPSRREGTHSVIADLLNPADASRVLRGAEVAYLTAGLPYSSRVWADQWPTILRNTIDSALEHSVHLVYFDNVYAYGPVAGAMTENTPIAHNGRKGRVRAAALRTLDEASARGLTVTIARSADFYGPGAQGSVFNGFSLDKIAAGKDATWLFNADQPHSLTYTPDIGDALAILGTDPRGTGRTWHVPTAPALTGRQYIQLAGGPSSRTKVMGHTMMRVGSLFNTAARETLELAYQYSAPYLFDSHAFETEFGVTPTPVADGIATTLEQVQSTTSRVASV